MTLPQRRILPRHRRSTTTAAAVPQCAPFMGALRLRQR